MTTHRLIPPGGPGTNPITVNGRTYSCAAGSTIDVPDFDAQVLMANGWSTAAAGGAGLTANRPANPTKGMQFHDTTLNSTVVYDGRTWRNPKTGAAV